jgi:hypothetical protein
MEGQAREVPRKRHPINDGLDDDGLVPLSRSAVFRSGHVHGVTGLAARAFIPTGSAAGIARARDGRWPLAWG